jgi:hypothetical protein
MSRLRHDLSHDWGSLSGVTARASARIFPVPHDGTRMKAVNKSSASVTIAAVTLKFDS